MLYFNQKREILLLAQFSQRDGGDIIGTRAYGERFRVCRGDNYRASARAMMFATKSATNPCAKALWG